MSKQVILYNTGDDYQLSGPVSAGSVLSNQAMMAMENAVNFEDAMAGKVFRVSSEAKNAGVNQFSKGKDQKLAPIPLSAPPKSAPPKPAATGGSVSSSDLGELDALVVFSTHKVVQSTGDKIDMETLELIRKFKPTEADKQISFLDFEPRTSSVLQHRERIMALIRMRYSLDAIRLMVDSKGTQVVQDSAARAAVAGIPKRKLALVLSDSVLVHRETDYSNLLRELFENRCVVTSGLLELVPNYIGTANILGVPPTPEQTQRSRQRYLEATANYLRPLYTNEVFRTQIAKQKAASSPKGSVPTA